jgi:hypothetical protein
MQHGLAHGLAGDGAGVHTNPADDFALLHEDYPMAAFRPLYCCALSSRAGADDNEIVCAHELERLLEI